jgi:integrase
MIAAAGGTIRDLRNKALLTAAYTTLARRSELIGFLREDLEIDAEGLGTVLVRRSKTDQEGQGEIAVITPDAMRHLSTWLSAAGIEAGPLFRAVHKSGQIGDLLGEWDIPRIFKQMAKRAGLSAEEIAHISGHSTRVGAAQDMIRLGAELPAAMQAGRWKTAEMVSRYSRRLSARRNAAAQIAERRVAF